MKKYSALADWTPEQIARAKRWVESWRRDEAELNRLWRKKIRALDTYTAISRLCVSTDPPHALKPISGLVEMQRWFMKLAEREQCSEQNGK